MPGLTGPSLDDEGIPDLSGPLPEKELTGDPQEGVAPPVDRPHAETDWGITGTEQRSGEPLDVRVRHERPDLGETDPVEEVARDLRLDDDDSEREWEDPADFVANGDASRLAGQELIGDDPLDDDEGQEVAMVVDTDQLEGQSAEEAAVHIVDDDEV